MTPADEIEPMTENEANRARYEIHLRALDEVDFSRHPDGTYVSPDATAMWDFWQAAQASIMQSDLYRAAVAPQFEPPIAGWQEQALQIIQQGNSAVAGQCAIRLLRIMLAVSDVVKFDSLDAFAGKSCAARE